MRGLCRLAVGLGPIRAHMAVVEIQRPTGGVLELLVERLARDLLGDVVTLRFLDLVGAPVTPPGKLAGLGFHALLDDATDGVRETVVAQAVEHLAWGDGLGLLRWWGVLDHFFFKDFGLVLGDGGLGRVSCVQWACKQGCGQTDHHPREAHGRASAL
ncbi:hypothetical protein D3C81_1053740 [compost metagenome]